MKKILVLLLFTCTLSFAQTTSTYDVYLVKDWIPSFIPSAKIEVTPTHINVYEYNNWIPNVVPSAVIVPTNNNNVQPIPVYRTQQYTPQYTPVHRTSPNGALIIR